MLPALPTSPWTPPTLDIDPWEDVCPLSPFIDLYLGGLELAAVGIYFLKGRG